MAANDIDTRLLRRIAAVMAGNPAQWPETDAEGATDRALVLAREHGALPLLDYRIREQSLAGDWPSRLRLAAADSARRQLMIDAVIADGLGKLISALDQRDIQPVFLKGVALAWSLYPEPWTRPRQDTDLLLQPESLAAAREVFTALGYRQLQTIPGTLVFQQESWSREFAPGLVHELDVHTAITNSHAFNNCLSAENFHGATTALTTVCATARRPDDCHAMLHSAVHRVAHHGRSQRLIWLYDIHLLADTLDAESRERLIGVARHNALLSALHDGTREACRWFPSASLEALNAELESLASVARRESTRPLVTRRVGRLAWFVADLRAVRGAGAKLQFIRENMFPPEAWLRARFGTNGEEWTSTLFLRRIIRGFASLCQGSRAI